MTNLTLLSRRKVNFRRALIERLLIASKNRIVNGILYVIVLISLLAMLMFCMYFALVAAASTPY